MHKNERNFAEVDVAPVVEEGASCALKPTWSVDPVLPSPPSCDLMEGGLGI